MRTYNTFAMLTVVAALVSLFTSNTAVAGSSLGKNKTIAVSNSLTEAQQICVKSRIADAISAAELLDTTTDLSLVTKYLDQEESELYTIHVFAKYCKAPADSDKQAQNAWKVIGKISTEELSRIKSIRKLIDSNTSGTIDSKRLQYQTHELRSEVYGLDTLYAQLEQPT